MKIVLITVVLSGFMCALGYAVWKMSGKLIEPEDGGRNCLTCKYGDLDWDEDPCDSCSEDHDCWEAKDEDK